MVQNSILRTGMLALGSVAFLWTAENALGHGVHGGGGGGGGFHGSPAFHGAPGFNHGGAWGHGGYHPYFRGCGLGFYGLYPGWYSYNYPYYPYYGLYGYGGFGLYGYGGFSNGAYGYGSYVPPYAYPPSVAASPAMAAPTAASPAAPVYVTVHVPADADVWFNGTKTQQKGPTRQFMTPPVRSGYNYRYEVRAVWMSDGQPVTQTRTIVVQPGENVDVRFVSPETGAATEPNLVQQLPALASPAPRPTFALGNEASFGDTGGSQAARIDQDLQLLSGPDEAARLNAIMDLGRRGAGRAIDPLIGILSSDASPAARDAAARALGLIADPRSLPALSRAAQADNDRDVRHSAQFAVEIIRARSPN